MALTPLGDALLPHARRALEEADAVLQLSRARRDPLAGPLRLGAIPTLAPYLVPLILVPLRRRYPALKLVLSEELTETLLECLRHHEIEAALIATPVSAAEFAACALFEGPFRLALPRRHPLCRKARITRRALDALDVLLLSVGHCLAAQAMEICRIAERGGAGEHADLRAASLDTLLQLVGGGLGVTLVAALGESAALG